MEIENAIESLTRFYSIAFLISLLVNGLLIYLIWRRSTQCIGIYKWFLLNMTIKDLLMSIAFEQLLSPIPLSVKPIFLLTGIGRCIHKAAIKFLVGITGTLVFLSLASPMLCFFYRYSVTTTKDTAAINNSHNNTLTSCCKKSTLFAAIGFELICITITFCVTTFFVVDTDQQRLRNENQDFNLNYLNSTKWTNRIIYALDMGNAGRMGAIVPAMVLITTLTCIILAWLIIKSLNSQKSSMSLTTYALQKRFTHALIVQALYPTILLSIPYLSMILEVHFGILTATGGITPYVPFVALGCMASYPIVNAAVTIYFVTPYRNATVNIWKRIFIDSYRDSLDFWMHTKSGRRLSELLARQPMIMDESGVMI